MQPISQDTDEAADPGTAVASPGKEDSHASNTLGHTHATCVRLPAADLQPSRQLSPDNGNGCISVINPNDAMQLVANGIRLHDNDDSAAKHRRNFVSYYPCAGFNKEGLFEAQKKDRASRMRKETGRHGPCQHFNIGQHQGLHTSHLDGRAKIQALLPENPPLLNGFTCQILQGIHSSPHQRIASLEPFFAWLTPLHRHVAQNRKYYWW